MHPNEQNTRSHGVTCKECGVTFQNQSAAEIHRYERHTPPAVLAHYITISNSLK